MTRSMGPVTAQVGRPRMSLARGPGTSPCATRSLAATRRLLWPTPLDQLVVRRWVLARRAGHSGRSGWPRRGGGRAAAAADDGGDDRRPGRPVAVLAAAVGPRQL